MGLGTTMNGVPTMRLLIGALAAAAALSGCQEEDSDPPNPCDAAACDILEADCQQAVMTALRCFRGGDEDVMPDVDVITEDEYVDIVKGPEPSDEQLERHDRFTRGMALLKLAPEMADMDQSVEEYASQIAAAYLTGEDRVVVIDRGMPLDSQGSVATFAHELVHALQDREVGIEDFYAGIAPTLDATLAARALIEGEATHYALLMYAGIDGAYPAFIDFTGYYTNYQLEMLIDGYDDESPLALSFVRFPYAFGGDYVSERWVFGGQRAVSALFDAPPLSTADVITRSMLTPEAAQDAADLHEVSQLSPIEGYETVAYDELGSFIYDGFLHRMEATKAVALDLQAVYLIADGVTVLYDEENDHVVTAWRLRFSEERTPDEDRLSALREALDAPDEDSPDPSDDVMARVYVDDRDLIVLLSDAPLAQELLGDDVAWEPAPTGEEAEDEMPTAALWCGGSCPGF